MNDQFEASIEEAYERGVEAGRLDAVPPNTEPMRWCWLHDSQWFVSYSSCRISRIRGLLQVCELEDPVGHWVTVKEETA